MKITFKGNPLTLQGAQLKQGDTLKEFVVAKNDLSPLRLSDTKGVRIFLSVPSLDTPVCDLEVKEFNKRVGEMPGVSIYAISLDLPFAQARWVKSYNIDGIVTVSDYKERSFAAATGTFINELGLLARAAFVVDASDKIVYAEYVQEVSEHPNYEAILNAAKLA